MTNSSATLNTDSKLTILIKNGTDAKFLVDPYYCSVNSEHRARSEDLFFILLDSEIVVGVVRHCFENGVSMLRSMNIHPDYRGKKLGLRLLRRFEDFLNENKIHETFCIPYAHLLNFYSQIGFRQFAESDAPQFLQDRLSDYRERHRDKKYSIMKRVIPK